MLVFVLVDVDAGVSSVDISATPTVDTTTYYLADDNVIRVGDNNKRIVVTAEDGSYSIYVMTNVTGNGCRQY